MPDRILIFGNGWLGNKLAKALSGKIANVNITQRHEVSRALDEVSPTVVVNAAGKTGRPNVDSCEAAPGSTLLANVAGPILLATECLFRGIFFVHLGSGCVYDGWKTDYKEDDPPNFFGSVYSRSKILAEQALKNLNVLQLRLRMPFEGEPGPRNLITKLLKYPRVINIPNSLTYIPDFIEIARQLIARRAIGVWNVVNGGSLTHPEILERYRALVDPGLKFEEMSLEELSKVTTAGRSNCVLSTEKLRAAGIKVRPVKEALEEALRQYKEAL